MNSNKKNARSQNSAAQKSKGMIIDDFGKQVKASCPVIISASRSTDIPAFYSDWLISRVEKGYVKWKNPFNGKFFYVSFADTRLFVFWTKNPLPMLDKLNYFSKFNYYFQYTLNDYQKEQWESNLPPLEQRIETFIRLSENIGKEKVIWRFDPIILSKFLQRDQILERIENIGNKIHRYTKRLVISFIDIDIYKKVKANLNQLSDGMHEIDDEDMIYIANGISKLNKNWGLKIGTCSEKIDLDSYGIEHNRCIDDRLIISLFANDDKLMNYLRYDKDAQLDIFEQNIDLTKNYLKLRDKGQRELCGCIKSKDIGQYDTCPHGCVYCYANSNHKTAYANWKKSEGSNKDTIV